MLDGSKKFHAIKLHQELQCVTTRLAAEAVVELLVLADAERRRLFVMERTEPSVVVALFLEIDTRLDDLNDVDPGQHIVNKILRNQRLVTLGKNGLREWHPATAKARLDLGQL